MAVAMLVKAHSSNHEPNQETDRDLKWLSDRDLVLCEQALSIMANAPVTPSCKALLVKAAHKDNFHEMEWDMATSW